jgi:hypothetical protein
MAFTIIALTRARGAGRGAPAVAAASSAVANSFFAGSGTSPRKPEKTCSKSAIGNSSHCAPVKVSRPAAVSNWAGHPRRRSALHTMRAPKDGTGPSSGQRSTGSTARRDGKASRSERTPSARMLASVIGCEGDEQRTMICDLMHSCLFGRLVSCTRAVCRIDDAG